MAWRKMITQLLCKEEIQNSGPVDLLFAELQYKGVFKNHSTESGSTYSSSGKANVAG